MKQVRAGGQCQWRKLQQRWMMVLVCSVNVCVQQGEVKRRNETSTRRRYGSNEWTRDRGRVSVGATRVPHRGSVWGWHRTLQIQSTGAVDLILRCQTQILLCTSLACLVSLCVCVMSATFGQSWGGVAQSVFPAPKFFRREILVSMMVL